MSDKYQPLTDAILREIQKIKNPDLRKLQKVIETKVEYLCEKGLISFGHDYSLTGLGLECRIKIIFQKMGFSISRGRDGMEDFVIKVPESLKPNTPIVLEVKSSRKPIITRDELRQLDDWVFDLSKEERARKYGLGGGGGVDPLAIVSQGMITRESRPRFHPSPHKGVMVFNGPIGSPFQKREIECLSQNDEEFVNKRNFCIIPFNILISYFEEYQTNNDIKSHLWEQIHLTTGILPFLPK